MVLLLTGCMAAPAFAEAIAKSINKLYTLICGIVAAIGSITLVWGVFEFATAWQDHNTSQVTVGLKKIVSGLMMLGISGLVSYLTT